METWHPADWIKLSKDEFRELIEPLNYTRTGYSDGIEYTLVGYNKRFAVHYDRKEPNEYYVDPYMLEEL